MIPANDFKMVMSHAGYYEGPVDGSLNGACLKAAEEAIQDHLAHMPDDWHDWPNSRKIVVAVQVVLTQDGYDVGPADGFYGPLTAEAIYDYHYFKEQGERPTTDWRPDEQEPQSKPAKNEWPNSAGLIKYFGEPGGKACTAGVVKLPYPMRLAWDLKTEVTTIRCHERVADSASRALQKIADAYSPEYIESMGFDLFGGCFNHRLKRGGTTLSVHSFGAAIDFDPLRNQLRWGKDRASLARPEADDFWRIWESEKWVSLGRARNFDWMHVQAVNL